MISYIQSKDFIETEEYPISKRMSSVKRLRLLFMQQHIDIVIFLNIRTQRKDINDVYLCFVFYPAAYTLNGGVFKIYCNIDDNNVDIQWRNCDQISLIDPFAQVSKNIFGNFEYQATWEIPHDRLDKLCGIRLNNEFMSYLLCQIFPL